MTAPGSTTAPPGPWSRRRGRRHRLDAPSPTTVPPVSLASGATSAVGRTRRSPQRPGTAGDGARPRTRSAEPRTKACGVPRSSQYVESTMPWRWAPAASRPGKVSRSTETGRPAGMVSMTERRKTYAPALIWSVTISSGVCGFSRNAVTRPGVVRGDQPVRARVGRPGSGGARRRRRCGSWVSTSAADVEAGEDVAVEDEHRIVGAGVQPGRRRCGWRRRCRAAPPP